MMTEQPVQPMAQPNSTFPTAPHIPAPTPAIPAAPTITPEVAQSILAQAAAEVAPNGDGIKRFTSRTPTKTFYVDSDAFEVRTSAPAAHFAPLLAAFTAVGGDVGKQYEAAKNIMASSLVPESWARFEGRLSDVNNPIGHVELVTIAAWVIEVQAERPTGLAQSSTDSPTTTGTTSTGGA